MVASKSSYENVSFVTSVEVASAVGTVFFQTEEEVDNGVPDVEICLCSATYGNRFDTPRNGMNIRTFLYGGEVWTFCSDAFKFLQMSSGGSRLNKLPLSSKGTVTILGTNSKYFKVFSLSGLIEFIDTVGKNSTQYRKAVAQNLIQTLQEAEEALKSDTAWFSKNTKVAEDPVLADESSDLEPVEYSLAYSEADALFKAYYDQYSDIHQDLVLSTSTKDKDIVSSNYSMIYPRLDLSGYPRNEAIEILCSRIRCMAIDIGLLSK